MALAHILVAPALQRASNPVSGPYPRERNTRKATPVSGCLRVHAAAEKENYNPKTVSLGSRNHRELKDRQEQPVQSTSAGARTLGRSRGYRDESTLSG